MVERVGLRDVGALAANGGDQLDLVMQVMRCRRIGNRGAAHHQRVGRLAEEERRLPVRVVAHFAGMGGIVATDAVDPADRKLIVAVGDGNTRLCRRGNHEGHGQGPLFGEG